MDNKVSKVLVIGAGPIKIGQACEFDYSGTQVCNTLKSEGIFTILFNSNPATYMTSNGVADRIYIESLTVNNLLKILEDQKPDAIIPFAGGQTALNLALALKGSKFEDIKLLGTNIECIKNSEDRRKFHQILKNNHIDCLDSFSVNGNMKVMESAKFPLILRTSYSLGGSSSCVVNSYDDYIKIYNDIYSKDNRSEIYAEEYVDGLAEYELEVVKDKNGECCVICCIENMDPMGIFIQETQ